VNHPPLERSLAELIDGLEQADAER